MDDLNQLLLGRKGGKSSAEIIQLLFNRPYNTNQIANQLDIGYNSVQYHIKILIKNNIVLKESNEYGSLIFLTPEMEKKQAEFERLIEKIGK